MFWDLQNASPVSYILRLFPRGDYRNITILTGALIAASESLGPSLQLCLLRKNECMSERGIKELFELVALLA